MTYLSTCSIQHMDACMLSRFSRVQLCATLWTAARQAPPSMGFSRQEYWSGLLCPPPGDLSNPRIQPVSLKSTCTGRRVLYHQHHLGSPQHGILLYLFSLSCLGVSKFLPQRFCVFLDALEILSHCEWIFLLYFLIGCDGYSETLLILQADLISV